MRSLVHSNVYNPVMKMDYIDPRTGDRPMIRLYAFNSEEIAQLCSGFSSLACGEKQIIALHEQPYIAPVNNCHLTLKVGPKDEGITKIADSELLEWALTSAG